MVANAILFLYRDFENECNKAMRYIAKIQGVDKKMQCKACEVFDVGSLVILNDSQQKQA